MPYLSVFKKKKKKKKIITCITIKKKNDQINVFQDHEFMSQTRGIRPYLIHFQKKKIKRKRDHHHHLFIKKKKDFKISKSHAFIPKLGTFSSASFK